MKELNCQEGVGFKFDLARRNALLEQQGLKPPPLYNTGTTLVGVVFKDGVILATDTRSTMGSTVADKNCFKLHRLAPNIYAAGSGVAADTAHSSSMVESALTLHRYDTGRDSRVVTAVTMLKSHLTRYQGHIVAALLVAGVDHNGPHLFDIYPHGSVDCLPFATMGSGCLAAISVLEAGYKDNMSKEQAIQLVTEAIRAGIFHDDASGSNIDIMIITKDGKEYHRNYQYLMGKTYTPKKPVVYPPGTTSILEEKMVSLREVAVLEGDAMDIS